MHKWDIERRKINVKVSRERRLNLIAKKNAEEARKDVLHCAIGLGIAAVFALIASLY